jgi:hypothetical protein
MSPASRTSHVQNRKGKRAALGRKLSSHNAIRVAIPMQSIIKVRGVRTLLEPWRPLSVAKYRAAPLGRTARLVPQGRAFGTLAQRSSAVLQNAWRRRDRRRAVSYCPPP